MILLIGGVPKINKRPLPLIFFIIPRFLLLRFLFAPRNPGLLLSRHPWHRVTLSSKMLASPLYPSTQPVFSPNQLSSEDSRQYRPSKDLETFNSLLPPPVEFVEGSSSDALAVPEGKYEPINTTPKRSSDAKNEVSSILLYRTVYILSALKRLRLNQNPHRHLQLNSLPQPKHGLFIWAKSTSHGHKARKSAPACITLEIPVF